MDLQSCLEHSEQAVRVCRELSLVFDNERKFLVGFQSEALQQNQIKKEELLRELVHLRTEIKGAKATLADALGGSSEWKKISTQWHREWQQMKQKCEENQELIKHSLRNMEVISDHLMRLLGQLTLYNSKGNRSDLSVHRPSGKVVEGTY